MHNYNYVFVDALITGRFQRFLSKTIQPITPAVCTTRIKLKRHPPVERYIHIRAISLAIQCNPRDQNFIFVCQKMAQRVRKEVTILASLAVSLSSSLILLIWCFVFALRLHRTAQIHIIQFFLY